MILLVDTTVWIDFFAGRSEEHVAVLESSIQQKDDICICGIILTEVLQGIRNEKEYNKTKVLFEKLVYIPMARDSFLQAAEMYRSLRRRGITIRKPLDCMIAAVAMKYDIPLLHNDRDFDLIEKNCGLKSVKSKKW